VTEETAAKLPEGFTGLLIAIPNVSGEMRTELATALIQAAVLLTKLEIQFGVYWVIGSSAVERARNSIIEEFMRKEEFSHLLMIDDDMDFDHRMILKILSNKHEVCYAAGVKKKKPSDARPEFAMFPLGRENPICPDCGCIEMGAGGCCFMLASKDAIEKMLEHFKDLWYIDDEDREKRVPALFNPYLEPDSHIYRAEDVAFYYRWRSVGGRVWLDPSIQLGHWGPARWSGDIMKSFSLTDEVKEE
jgi:hypothetical protein